LRAQLSVSSPYHFAARVKPLSYALEIVS